MSTHTSTETSDGFSAAERAAIKQRAAELRAEGRSGAKKAEGLQALLDSIAKMDPADRAIAERVHVTVTAHAPDLAPRTWYGMPAYTNAEGKVVLSFKNAGKFGQRYSTLEFPDSAHLDDGDLWPVGFALLTWTPQVQNRVAALGRAAVSGRPADSGSGRRVDPLAGVPSAADHGRGRGGARACTSPASPGPP